MNINGTGKITFRPENINLPIPESEVVDNDLLAPGAPAVEYKF